MHALCKSCSLAVAATVTEFGSAPFWLALCCFTLSLPIILLGLLTLAEPFRKALPLVCKLHVWPPCCPIGVSRVYGLVLPPLDAALELVRSHLAPGQGLDAVKVATSMANR